MLLLPKKAPASLPKLKVIIIISNLFKATVFMFAQAHWHHIYHLVPYNRRTSLHAKTPNSIHSFIASTKRKTRPKKKNQRKHQRHEVGAIIRKTQRREGWFWQRLQHTELSSAGEKPGQPLETRLLVSGHSWSHPVPPGSCPGEPNDGDTSKQKTEGQSVGKQC